LRRCSRLTPNYFTEHNRKEDDMSRKILIAVIVCAFLVAFPRLASPADRTTDEEAMAMVEMAGQLIEEQGDLALPVISNPKGRFYNRENDLYIFILNDKFEVIANPYKPELIGVRYPENSPIRRIVTTALIEGRCSAEYTDRNCSEDDLHETTISSARVCASDATPSCISRKT
jgi:hypothetical protein